MSTQIPTPYPRAYFQGFNLFFCVSSDRWFLPILTYSWNSEMGRRVGSPSSDQFKQTTALQGPLTSSRPIAGHRLPWHVDVPCVCSYRTSPVFWPPWSSIATSDLFSTGAPSEPIKFVIPGTSWKSFLLTRKEQERVGAAGVSLQVNAATRSSPSNFHLHLTVLLAQEASYVLAPGTAMTFSNNGDGSQRRKAPAFWLIGN